MTGMGTNLTVPLYIVYNIKDSLGQLHCRSQTGIYCFLLFDAVEIVNFCYTHPTSNTKIHLNVLLLINSV